MAKIIRELESDKMIINVIKAVDNDNKIFRGLEYALAYACQVPFNIGNMTVI